MSEVEIGRRDLGTVLVTDIVESTALLARLGDARGRALLDAHDRGLREALERHGGLEVNSTGDGFIALFGPPAPAVRCATEVRAAARELGLDVRIGVHTGEVERVDERVAGLTLHVACRICAEAAPAEILVSAAVRDIGAGAAIRLDDRGARALRGVPGEWRLYAVAAEAGERGENAGDAAGEPSPPALTSVLIVDDHPLWRRTLRTVIEHGLLARRVLDAGTEAEAVETAVREHPAVVVMDIDLAGGSGIEATRRIVAADTTARVLILSSSHVSDQVAAAVHAGARGYLLKTSRAGEIVAAIRTVATGGLAFPPELADAVLQALKDAAPPAPPPTAVSTCVVAPSLIDRTGVAAVLEGAGLQVARACADVAAVETADDGRPCVLVAVDPPAGWGDALAAAAASPSTALLLVADRTYPRLAELLGRRGGVGQVSRRRLADPDDLVLAVRRVARGEIVIDAAAAGDLLGGGADPVRALSDREVAVLRLLASGASNSAVGEQLHLSPKTVEAHIGAIFSKLGLEASPDAHRRVQAVLAYLRSPLAEGQPP